MSGDFTTSLTGFPDAKQETIDRGLRLFFGDLTEQISERIVKKNIYGDVIVTVKFATLEAYLQHVDCNDIPYDEVYTIKFVLPEHSKQACFVVFSLSCDGDGYGRAHFEKIFACGHDAVKFVEQEIASDNFLLNDKRQLHLSDQEILQNLLTKGYHVGDCDDTTSALSGNYGFLGYLVHPTNIESKTRLIQE